MNLYTVAPEGNYYDGLQISSKKDIEFLLSFFRKYRFEQIKIDWQTINVALSPQQKKGDFFRIFADDLAVNQHAWNALAPIIENSVEVLPLNCQDGIFFYLHVLDQLDCLDHEKTVYRDGGSSNLWLIDKYAFREELIGERNIFWLEYAGFTVVTQAFKDCVVDNALEGLIFTQVN
jgi:hypothetical protein